MKNQPVSYNDMLLAEVGWKLAYNTQRQMDLLAYRVITADPLSWEERLSLAIERQSVRNRLRRISARVRSAHRKWSERISYAFRALRGEWPEW